MLISWALEPPTMHQKVSPFRCHFPFLLIAFDVTCFVATRRSLTGLLEKALQPDLYSAISGYSKYFTDFGGISSFTTSLQHPPEWRDGCCDEKALLDERLSLCINLSQRFSIEIRTLRPVKLLHNKLTYPYLYGPLCTGVQSCWNSKGSSSNSPQS